jgi:uncharacterized protein YjbI with pentapeptide repeats
MLTKNLTPFLFGSKLTSRKPPQPEMTMVVRGAFALAPDRPLTPLVDLEQGFLTADVFREEDEDRSGECIYASDFADFKLRAEILLRASCYAPRGRPVTECPVRVTVGEWSKTLRVVGPRAWSDSLAGAVMSSPLAFTKMPISYKNSFGGPGFLRNPVGKGVGTTELPTIEHPAEPIRSRSDEVSPAGFGPLNAAWPPRAGKVGRAYGKSYQETRAPYYAEDFDWSYFNAAPADQQLPGYLRGDEEVTLHNLHPAAPVLSTRLPGLRVRAFVKDVERRFREVYMALDTLFMDPDKGVLTLTWRGVDKVREDDLSDVKLVLIASEPLADRPLPEKHYQMLMEQIEKDPFGLNAAFDDGFKDAASRAEKEEAGEPPPAGETEGMDPVSAMLKRKLGRLGEAEQKRVRDAMAELKPAAAKGNIDLDAATGTALETAADEAPPVVPIKPGSLPDVGLRKRMRAVMATVAELKKEAREKNLPLPDIEKLEQMPFDPRLTKIDPSYTPPGPISTDEPGPGKDLSEQDLSRRDLSGLDLSNAKMEGTILTGAKLRGTKLAGANLKKAVLYKADLAEADLSGADLTLANMTLASAIGASFAGATVEQAFFEEANLTRADLSGAKGEYVVFTKANLTGARARDATFDHSDFSESSLEESDFLNASLSACLFAKCRGRQADLAGARLTASSFADADLKGARFVRARGERILWFRANLDGADFTLAVFLSCHFTEASAVGAKFFGANLRECRFYRATLDRAEIVKANLFSADLGKAKLNGTRFTGSNLYDAKFLQASGAGADFTGANLKRSTLERA